MEIDDVNFAAFLGTQGVTLGYPSIKQKRSANKETNFASEVYCAGPKSQKRTKKKAQKGKLLKKGLKKGRKKTQKLENITQKRAQKKEVYSKKNSKKLFY